MRKNQWFLSGKKSAKRKKITKVGDFAQEGVSKGEVAK